MSAGGVFGVQVIDLHCHILPGIDDGAPDIDLSLAMARRAVEDGITITACTPHIMPGYYENAGPGIREHVKALQTVLDENDIPLTLTTGADVHLVTDLVAGLKAGRILSLADSRYFLFEPPHNVAPPRMMDSIFDVMSAGYVPIITHPERLRWIEEQYNVMGQAVHNGAWIQLTAASVTGKFGKRPQYWSERMLDEGLVHILATDAHNMRTRSPILSEAVEAVSKRLGEEAARDMVFTRPRAVLDNAVPSSLPPPVGAPKAPARSGFFQRLFNAA